MNKINQFLKKDNIQRRSYVVLLIIWIFIFLNADIRYYITSYTDYLPLIFIIPVLLLVLQILFNNRIIWFFIATCIGTYTLWQFFKIYTHIVINQHRAYSHAIEWNTEIIFRLGFGILILIAINWFLFKIKPLKSDVSITSIDC